VVINVLALYHHHIQHHYCRMMSMISSRRRSVYRVLVGKPEGEGLLGGPRHRWEDNIKMSVQEVGFGGMDWIDLAEDRAR
jgi:ribulose bisphosphate carboxylase small subunit